MYTHTNVFVLKTLQLLSAMVALGDMYIKRGGDGALLAKRLYKVAAKQGHATAQHKLAVYDNIREKRPSCKPFVPHVGREHVNDDDIQASCCVMF